MSNSTPWNTVFLCAGHGGLNSNGVYTTPARNGKRFTHKGVAFSTRVSSPNNPEEFLEGVKNRSYCTLINQMLTDLGVHVVPVYNEQLDTALEVRTRLANTYHTQVARGIYLSEHSNAFNGTARGFCVFTSPGRTTSDDWAESIINGWDTIKDPSWTTRTDTRDGDKDYEAQFWVLTKTNMPAILTENLFFDNLQDALILDNVDYMNSYCQMVANRTKEFLDTLNN